MHIIELLLWVVYSGFTISYYCIWHYHFLKYVYLVVMSFSYFLLMTLSILLTMFTMKSHHLL